MPGQLACLAQSGPDPSKTIALTTGWECASTSAGAIQTPADLIATAATWHTATVPGTVAAALRALGTWSLDNPPRAFDGEDHWYRLRFDYPFNDAARATSLNLAGLATVADVWLNDEHVLRSDNMFVAHELRIEHLLRAHNELVIRFLALDTELAKKRPRPRWRTPMVSHQQLRHLRTTLLGRTPGWSPPCPPVGPWRSVTLEQHIDCQPSALMIRTRIEDGKGIVELCSETQSHGIDAQIVTGELVVSADGHAWHASCAINNGRITATLTVPDVKLWWPHTHGEPFRYTAQLNFATSSGNAYVGKALHIGFRSIRLDTDNGNFAIWINDVRVFCRGACWTPLDVVTLAGTPEQYNAAIAQVRDCGMNMLRVGGTMVYESDAFYDECDRQGILVWQDFMFANMDYPEGDTAFSESISKEITQQLGRIAHRPSLTVLCGNSEVEQQAAMWGAPRSLWAPQLFHSFIPALVQRLAPEIPYWPSSAHGGAFPHQGDIGTTSYYGVGAYLRPLEDARRSDVKFASECLAFANIPEDSGIEKMPRGLSLRVHHPEWKARTPRDLGAGWDFEDVRDYYLQSLFGVDPMQLRYADHDRYMMLSRMVVGELMTATIGEWRRRDSKCGGALVWFLRDFWPGAGWGLVDSERTPKAPYYYFRRAAQSTAVAITNEGGNGLFVHVANDANVDFVGTLTLAIYKSGERAIEISERPITIAARESMSQPIAECFTTLFDLSNAYRFGPPGFSYVVARLTDRSGTLVSQRLHVRAFNEMLHRSDIGLTAIAKAIAPGNYEVTFATSECALGVIIAADGYIGDDQYFDLIPGFPRTFAMRIASGAAPKPLRATVNAMNAQRSSVVEIRN